jgi:hypothetical protein
MLSRIFSSPRRRAPNSIRPLRIENLERRDLLSGAPPTVTGVYVGSTQWSSAFYDYLNPSSGPDWGFRIPTGSSAQIKSLPWSNIDQVSIQFSKDVDIQIGDLSISGVSATVFPFSHFFYDAVNCVATWTLTSALPKNSYQLDLNGGGLDPVHEHGFTASVLDGEWANNSDTFPSGDGVAGGDFQFNFKVMPGDVNQNAAVETLDVNTVNSKVGQTTTSANYSAFADVDGSGWIQSADAQIVQSKLWSTYPSQNPIGVTNDAPSTNGGQTLSLTSGTGTYVKSLGDDFDDAETPDSQLSYQLTSNSNPELFTTASINASTKTLQLAAADGASGRAQITVRATDAAGLSTTATYVIDVNYLNVAPDLLFHVAFVSGQTFHVSGSMIDDDANLEGNYVTFSGAFNMRASIMSDGSYSFDVIVPREQWGEVTARAYDAQGLSSPEREQTAAVT